MPSVGTAYVNVRVNTRGFEDSLKSMLSKLSRTMEGEGEKLGKSFDRGFKNSTKDTFKSLETNAANASKKVTAELNKVGDAGKQMGRDVKAGTAEAGTGLQSMVDDAGDVHRALDQVDSSAKSAGRSLDSAGSSGGRAGGGFRRGARGASQYDDALSRLAKHGPDASRVLSRLYNTAAIGGTALAGLVSTASAAGQALFAVGANAAAATPALAVMANGLLSLAQVGTVVAISMQSVGQAISAGFKAADAAAKGVGASTASIGKATAGAARAVRDAKQGLQDAYRDAARAAADAARRVEEAEQNLAAAQMESRAAQLALNAAREEGKEQLEDIAFAAEDAELAEQRAALDLADAQQRLMEVSELAPDDRARVEAELAFKEAELNMRQAKDRREDADREQKRAAKEGVEGTDAVRSAHEDLDQALQNEADAEQDLADARRDAARQAEDSARRIADAQQAVADAQQSLADAQKSGAAAASAAATAMDEYQRMLDKLSPSQREFVERIVGMRDEFEEFSRDVGEPLFARLLTGMDQVNKKGKDGKSIMDILTAGLQGTSRALGDTAIKASELASDDLFQENLRGAMNANNQAMGHFGSAAVNLADAFVAVADAAGPLFLKFSKWVEAVTEGWAETAKAKNKTGELTDTFARAGKRVEDLWGFIKELWRWLTLVGGAADKAANRFGELDDKTGKPKGYLKTLTDSLKEFNDALDTPKGKKKMIEDFDQALKNLNATGRAFKNAVVDPLLQMGRDKEVETTMDKIAKSDAFDKLADNASEAAPLLADVALNVLDIMAALSESDSIKWFFKTLKTITGLVKYIVENPIVGSFLGAAGVVFGIRRALMLTKGVAKTLFAPAARMLDNIRTKAKNIKVSSTGGVSGGTAAATTKVAGAGADAKEGTWEAEVLVQLRLIVTAIETCCATMSRAMAGAAGGELLGAAPRGAAGAGALGAAGAAGAIPAGETAKIGKFAGVMGKFSKVLGPATKLLKPLSVGIRVLGAAFRFALGPIGMIVLTLLPILWPLLKKLDEKFHIVDKTMAALKWTLDIVVSSFQWLWDKIKELFEWVKSNWPTILAIITGPIGIAVLLITKNWDKIKAIIGAAVEFIKNLLVGMWDGIKAGWQAVEDFFNGLWSDHIKPILDGIIEKSKALLQGFWNGIKAGWNAIGDFIRNLWKDRIKPVIEALLTNAKNRLVNLFKGVITGWVVIGQWLGRLWRDKVQPKVTSLITSATEKLKTLWDGIKSGWQTIQNWMSGLWNSIKGYITGKDGLVTKVTDAISGIWGGLKDGLVDTWNDIVDLIEGTLEGGINKVLGVFGVKDITLDLPKMAAGGPVVGPGGPTSDRIPTLLSNGEFVLPAKSARGIGPQNLEYMRKHGKLPTGGLFGWIGDKFKSAVGALAGGVGSAVKWIVEKVTSGIDNLGGGFVTDSVTGFFKKYTDAIVDWLTDKQPAPVAGAPYTGPPGGWTYPVTGYVITQRPNSGHSPSWAVDLAVPSGRIVRAASRGTVAYARSIVGSYGNYVVINHAGGQQTLYAHLRNYIVKGGQSVSTGQTIGYADSTGNSSGNHLHFELKPSSDTIAAMAAHGVHLAQGGVVAPSAGGTLALIAEAGQHERVTPLDSEGFTPAERRMLEALESSLGTGGGDTYNVHPSRGMDETALADMVARRVAWKRRRGAGR